MLRKKKNDQKTNHSFPTKNLSGNTKNCLRTSFSRYIKQKVIDDYALSPLIFRNQFLVQSSVGQKRTFNFPFQFCLRESEDR